MRRLLFLYIRPSTFILDDLRMLRRHFDVRAFCFEEGETGGIIGLSRRWKVQYDWLKQELPEAEAVFGWFVDYHMVLPARMARQAGKPVVVCMGGFDANTLPELGYGVFHSRWRGPLARYVYRNSSMLLPVTRALMHHESCYATWPDCRANGVLARMPGLSTAWEELPVGYDLSAWTQGPDEREPLVVTVAFVDSDRLVAVKGLDLFIEAARQLPEATFEAIGIPDHFAGTIRDRFDLPRNLHLRPPLPREELVQFYRHASVYTQLSRTEGQPNVLCEAMACGCIPVGSTVGGIPDIIGEVGFVVARPEPGHIAEAIAAALSAGPERRRAARERIERDFDTARREQRLLEILDVSGQGRGLHGA